VTLVENPIDIQWVKGKSRRTSAKLGLNQKLESLILYYIGDGPRPASAATGPTVEIRRRDLTRARLSPCRQTLPALHFIGT